MISETNLITQLIALALTIMHTSIKRNTHKKYTKSNYTTNLHFSTIFDHVIPDDTQCTMSVQGQVVKGQGHSVKTASDRQIIALFRKSESLSLIAMSEF